MAGDVNLKTLSLEHITTHQTEMAEVTSHRVSPLILPDYRFEKALTTVQHIKGQTE